MGDEGLKASMKNLELAIQNGLFDEYFLIKLEEAHQENVGNERENKGRKEREEEIALKLKNDGFPYEKIAEITGLSLSEIEEL